MSWSRRGALAALTVLGGCGFRPLYGRGGGSTTIAALAGIDVGAVQAPPLDARVAQILRDEIARGLDPTNAGAARRFRLDLTLARTVEELAISSDDTVTRYNVRLSSDLSLVDLASGRPVYQTHVRTVGSYDVQRSDFGTVISEDATLGDAARDLGQRIVSILASFMARQPGS